MSNYDPSAVLKAWNNHFNVIIYYPLNVPDEYTVRYGSYFGPRENNELQPLINENKKCDCDSEGSTQIKESPFGFKNQVKTGWELVYDRYSDIVEC